MKDSASGSRWVAAAELTRWKRPPSIWRSSGVMSLSLRPDGRAPDIATRVANPSPQPGFSLKQRAFHEQRAFRGRPARTAPLLGLADRLGGCPRGPGSAFCRSVGALVV